MDVLSRLLDMAVLSGSFSVHPSCKDPLISHLSFADDLLIFFDGTSASLQGIFTILDEFYNTSGLRINSQKTVLFLDGYNLQALTRMAEEFNVSKGLLPVRYLGLPLSPFALKPSDYQSLLDKIQQRLNSWKVRHLSFAGRLQLITSVLNSMANFWLSIFILPKQCINKVESLCRSFLWNGDNSPARGAKVSWEEICKPKKNGGLGLRRLLLWNQVLCLKLLWLLISKSGSLWVAWSRKHLLRDGCLWVRQSPAKGSSQWKKLLKLKSLARPFVSCKIGCGSEISFWHDCWLPQGSLISIIGENGPRISGIREDSTVGQVIHRDQWLTVSTSRNPILSLLRSTLPLRPILIPSIPDQFLWKVSSSSFSPTFSTKSTWIFLQPPLQPFRWHKVVWLKLGIRKHSFLFWLAALGRLATRDRLISWGLNVPSHCLLCNAGNETLDHLLVQCLFVQDIWRSFLFPFTGLTSPIFSSVLNWARSRSVDNQLVIIERLLLQAIVYTIWEERNARIHGRNPSNQAVLFIKIKGMIKAKLVSTLFVQDHLVSSSSLLSIWFQRFQPLPQPSP